MIVSILVILAVLILFTLSFKSLKKETFAGGKACGDKDRCLPLDAKLDAWCGTKFEKPYLTPEERAMCPKK